MTPTRACRSLRMKIWKTMRTKTKMRTTLRALRRLWKASPNRGLLALFLVHEAAHSHTDENRAKPSKKEAPKASNDVHSIMSSKAPADKTAAPKAAVDKPATTHTDGLSKNQRKKLAKKAKAEAAGKPSGDSAIDAGEKKGKENKRSAEGESKDEKKSKKVRA
jgi:hypothetical protein